MKLLRLRRRGRPASLGQALVARTQTAERGQMILIFAGGMVALLAFVALAVDFGFWLNEQRTLRNYADAAALVGVDYLRPPLPDATKSGNAVLAAMTDLNRQMQLGITDLNAAAVAAQTSAGFSAADNDGYAGPDTFFITTPPNPDCGRPGSYVGNKRAITVRIAHQSERFFSHIFFSGTQGIGICATASSQGSNYAIAVLAPPGNNAQDQTTLTLSGANTIVNVSGGDVAVNATFAAAGNNCQNVDNCQVAPAHLQFLTDGNLMRLGLIPALNNQKWTSSPAQIQDPTGAYLAPVPLNPRITIPAWGPGAWIDSTTGQPYDPTAPGNSYLGGLPSGPVAGTCVVPTTSYGITYQVGLKPGNYSTINLNQGDHVWLCPGVFHFVASNSASLKLGNDAILAGQGVTLAFDNDVKPISTGGGQGAGAALLLNSNAAGGTFAPAPWTTGGRHDVPIAVWIEPVADCDPLAATPCSDSTRIFDIGGGSGIDERGVIFGPTDNMTIGSAPTEQASDAGEIWAWTLTYNGQSTLNQVFDGPEVSDPLLVQ